MFQGPDSMGKADIHVCHVSLLHLQVYGPAVTSEANERFNYKLRFYEAGLDTPPWNACTRCR